MALFGENDIAFPQRNADLVGSIASRKRNVKQRKATVQSSAVQPKVNDAEASNSVTDDRILQPLHVVNESDVPDSDIQSEPAVHLPSPEPSVPLPELSDGIVYSRGMCYVIPRDV